MSFQNLLEDTIDVALDTNLPCYAAGIYEAQIVKFGEVYQVEKKDKTMGTILPVIWQPLLVTVEGSEEVPKQLPKQKVWLDLTEEGKLDMGKGKNLGLGRLAKAFKLPIGWKIPDLLGCSTKIVVKNFPFTDGSIGAEVQSVMDKE